MVSLQSTLAYIFGAGGIMSSFNFGPRGTVPFPVLPKYPCLECARIPLCVILSTPGSAIILLSQAKRCGYSLRYD